MGETYFRVQFPTLSWNSAHYGHQRPSNDRPYSQFSVLLWLTVVSNTVDHFLSLSSRTPGSPGPPTLLAFSSQAPWQVPPHLLDVGRLYYFRVSPQTPLSPPFPWLSDSVASHTIIWWWLSHFNSSPDVQSTPLSHNYPLNTPHSCPAVMPSTTGPKLNSWFPPRYPASPKKWQLCLSLESPLTVSFHNWIQNLTFLITSTATPGKPPLSSS